MGVNDAKMGGWKPEFKQEVSGQNRRCDEKWKILIDCDFHCGACSSICHQAVFSKAYTQNRRVGISAVSSNHIVQYAGK